MFSTRDKTLSQLGLGVLVGVVIGAIVAVAIDWSMRKSDTLPPRILADQAFVQLCSDIQRDSGSIGYAFCLGKLRGFADGHMVTADTAAYLFPESSGGVKLWCISQTVTNKQLYDSVQAWVLNNEGTVDAISKKFDNADMFAAVMIAAFHATYPCTEKNHEPTI